MLDGPSRAAPNGSARATFLETYPRVVDALRRSSTRQVWVVASDSRFPDLVRAVSDSRRAVHRLTLFSYGRPDATTAVFLESAFGRLLLGPRATIPLDDLVEVLRADHPEDFCIAAEWLADARSIALWRGDFRMLTVPIGWFATEGAPRADPKRLSVEECGQTVRLGECEVSFDAVLYEQDPAARRRMRARMRAQDRTLGGSVRRLRELRGVRRGEFGEVDEKTIARIERGEVRKPRRATLDVIASRLGVGVDELESY